MADTNIKLNEVATLKDQMDQELEEVKALLKKVKTCCDKDPAESDTILNAIDQVGQELNSTWDNLMNTINSIGNEFNSWIKQVANAISQKETDVKNMKTGF